MMPSLPPKEQGRAQPSQHTIENPVKLASFFLTGGGGKGKSIPALEIWVLSDLVARIKNESSPPVPFPGCFVGWSFDALLDEEDLAKATRPDMA